VFKVILKDKNSKMCITISSFYPLYNVTRLIKTSFKFVVRYSLSIADNSILNIKISKIIKIIKNIEIIEIIKIIEIIEIVKISKISIS
jgi:hypothetical protein